jgi:hypothetical protein
MKHETFKIESEKLLDLGKPSLEALSFMLRHRETWPPGFEWNYTHCRSCAFGLAQKTWRLIANFGLVDEIAAQWFNISENDAFQIFYRTSIKRRCAMGAVTPEMVADDIDLHLACRS